MTKKSKAETSEKFTGIDIKAPKKTAAGLPAVVSSLKHIFSETPVLKGIKLLNQLNQKEGIDCPGCAWPDPDDERSGLGEYCENGAKAIAEEVSKKSIGAKFFNQHTIDELAELSDYKLGKQGRLTEPMYLPKGATNYQTITWEAAFALIGKTLNKLSTPDEAIFYTSGRTSNEAAFLYQLFVREFGTNNLPDCSNMCHESSGVALGETLGIGKGSVKLEDFYASEVIMIIGQNPGTNHPRMLSALEKAKANGATIISVNPLKEAGLIGFKHPQKIKGIIGKGSQLTDHYLQVRVNSDLALLQALNALLLKVHQERGGVFDETFIEQKTEGYQEYVSHLESLNIAELISHTGISTEQVELVADLLSRKSKIIVCWAMGLTQHKNAVATIKEVVNLLLLKGSIGKLGAGTCPVRGHSNVQGDRTMGIHEKPPKRLLTAIEKVFGFKPPQAHGYDVVNAIKAMHEGKAKVFFGMGGNFISATPDTLYTAEALAQCDLTVHVSTKLNRSHLVHGKEALILPCLGRTDKDVVGDKIQIVSVENSMGIVHSSRGSLTPVSKLLLSEPEIVCRLAKATLKNTVVNWDSYAESYDEIRNDIEKTIPGFDDYNTRVRVPAGFYLPNVARDQSFHPSTGKAHFTRSTYNHLTLENDAYLMTTIRSHDQFNTTIYGLDDRYRGIYNERRVVMMNQSDIDSAGLSKQEVVDLYNYDEGIERRAPRFIVVPYDIPKGCVATYFPEANVLVPINSTADKSNTPNSKSVIIKIKKRSEKS